MKKLMAGLVDSVSGGQSLSEAMGKHTGVFSPLYLSMIRVGEMGGILEKTTLQLTSILQRDDHIRTNMKNASAYPIFVMVLGFVSVGVIIAFILPKIINTIIGGMAVLPWPTRLLLGMSHFLTWCFTSVYGWGAMIAIIAGLVYLWRWIRTDGRLQWDSFKLRVPVLGSVLRTIAVGRFTRTLGSLTKGGVPILESLGIVRDTLGNEMLARQIDDAAEKVKTGSAVGPALQESGYFPPLLVQIVAIGEQTGQLDELLLSAADTFDEIADAAIARFMAVFPALMILVLALVIGFMIVAILLPIAMMSLGAGVF
jgi:type II secretory pathway component PulF